MRRVVGKHYLTSFFEPNSIAVFGASDAPGSVGGQILRNLMDAGFEGQVWPINPKHSTVLGRSCFADLSSGAPPVDLAIIATPAATVPAVLQQCGAHGVRSAVVISAGFEDSKLQGALLEEAARFGVRIIGPNCLGLIRTPRKLNATFGSSYARRGNLALLSQSGALCTAIVDWANSAGIGFSTVVSIGDARDVEFGELLDFLATDAETQSILMYVEGIRDARSFMCGLRVAARLKPVVVVKAGRHERAARAARSHTGALVGADDVFEAALRRAGAVRATTIDQLFAAAQLLGSGHRVLGNRLAVVTNAGGLGVMAADRGAELGIEFSELSPGSLEELNKALPAQWSHDNPIDILGDATAERYKTAVSVCMSDPQIDGTLVMLSPQAMTRPTECAAATVLSAQGSSKPLITCWMGGPQVSEARAHFVSSGVPTFNSPELSLDAFSYLWNHHRNRQLLLQVPGPLSYRAEHDINGARLIIDNVLAERRTLLTTAESKAVLKAFGIATTVPIWARSANEALIAAETTGFPVAIKIDSPDIAHKGDVGGVRLDVRTAEDVRNTYEQMLEEVHRKAPDARLSGVTVERMHRPKNGRECLVGVVKDAAFGPVISFGAGGSMVEIHKDRALALAPLNAFIIEDMIQRTRLSTLLGNWRGLPPVDQDALQEVLLKVSDLVCEIPHIAELDINPLVVDERGAIAVDARIVVHRPSPGGRRYSHMAIHPYPSHWVSHFQLPDGTNVVVRPIRPEDAEIEQSFVRSLSEESKYFRFMQSLNELTPEMLVRFTQIDYDREMAFIAITESEGREVEIGVARYVMNPDGHSCEFALVVADAWHGRGIGTRLMQSLIDAARQRTLSTMSGEILTINRHMLDLVIGLGFSLRPSDEDRSIQVASKLL
ncbi:MAG TPA: GNAT family N-acetyltransferase [Polyangiaceae bacterium]|nr:GNAT family N-acetyltransferase [Polyangiaceae bacterium]